MYWDRRFIILAIISLLIIVAAFALFVIPAPIRDTGASGSNAPVGTSTPVVAQDDLIRVTSPLPQSPISSPVIITGQARGSWYFEGQFPIQVLDANGQVIGQSPATAQGDWETTDYVPFTDTIILTTTPTSGSTGTVILQKANPSGNAATADSVSIPVVFQ